MTFTDLVRSRSNPSDVVAAAGKSSDATVRYLEEWLSMATLLASTKAAINSATLNRPYSIATSPTSPNYTTAQALRSLLPRLTSALQTQQVYKVLPVTVSGTTILSHRKSVVIGSLYTHEWDTWKPSFDVKTPYSGAMLLAMQLDFEGRRLGMVAPAYAVARQAIIPLIVEASVLYRGILERLDREAAARAARAKAVEVIQAAALTYSDPWKRDAMNALAQSLMFRSVLKTATSYESDYKVVVTSAIAWAKNTIGTINQAAEDFCRISVGCSLGDIATDWTRAAMGDLGNPALPTATLHMARYFENEARKRNWTDSTISAQIRNTSIAAAVMKAINENIRIQAADVERARLAEQERAAAQLAAAKAAEEARRLAEVLAAEQARAIQAERERIAAEEIERAESLRLASIEEQRLVPPAPTPSIIQFYPSITGPTVLFEKDDVMPTPVITMPIGDPLVAVPPKDILPDELGTRPQPPILVLKPPVIKTPDLTEQPVSPTALEAEKPVDVTPVLIVDPRPEFIDDPPNTDNDAPPAAEDRPPISVSEPVMPAGSGKDFLKLASSIALTVIIKRFFL